jgi:hypothetical protein
VKKLTCRDLGGPCDAAITGESFDEMGSNCHAHVMERIHAGDEAHRAAADRMRNASPEEQETMMAAFGKRYRDAPDV